MHETASDPTEAERRAHVEALRARKRAEAEAIGVDAEYISSFVERFYGKIRQDALLGPIFAERIQDWDVHLGRMKQFWRSVLHASGEFAGNPMVKHIAIPGLEERHFAHWLTLFYATLREEEPTDDDDLQGNPALDNETAWGLDVGYERRLGARGAG